MTTPISILAIDLAKGCFQVCAIGLDGAVLYNRVLSRTRLAALLSERTVWGWFERIEGVDAADRLPPHARLRPPWQAG